MSRCVIRYKICTLPGVKQRRLLDKAETDESQEGEGCGYPGHVVDPQPQRPEHQHAQEHQDAAHILARQLQIDTAHSCQSQFSFEGYLGVDQHKEANAD